MIEAKGLTKTYTNGTVATEVLKGISLVVETGDFVAVMGASGSGKSTLMNILGCLDLPSSGRYELDGVDVLDLDDDALSRLRNRKIGFVFQQFHLLPRTTALRNVLLPLIYMDDYPDDAEAQAERALEAVGLAHRVHYRPNELSGGELQRVAIARALITDPSVILADEPTGNLDSKNGAEVLAVFSALNEKGRTIVLITHDESVASCAERVLVIEDGRITERQDEESPTIADGPVGEAES